MEVPVPEDVTLKVSSKQEPGYAKKVAGAVAWRLRETGFCKIRAVKSDAVNTAVKSVAIVNQRLSSAGFQFCISPIFDKITDSKEEATAVEMLIKEAPSNAPTESVEYKVSGKSSEPDAETKLAGAISVPAREGKTVHLRCIGPSSVYRGIYAATIAKGHIYQNGFEAIIIPTWISMPAPDENSQPISLIQLEFWGHKITTEVQ